MIQTITLTGSDLTIKEILSVVDNKDIKIEVHKDALTRVKQSRKFLDQQSAKQLIYGINTGFGPMAGHIIGKDQLSNLQRNLIVSHAVGMGEPILNSYVLAAMVVRLNTFLKGYSGVSVELTEQLKKFINHRIIPIVPEHGAVGTSGDLVQLSHIALAIIGEGEVIFNDKKQKVASVMAELNIKPYVLKPKEGLAFINGTSMMTAIAAILCDKADTLLRIVIHSGAWSMEIVNAFSDSVSEVLHNLRPHSGQIFVAKMMREVLSSSKLLQNRHEFNCENSSITDSTHQIQREVQDVYSLRCIPQILGPVKDALEKTKEIVGVEINSVTDNPIVDVNKKEFLHGGNFHGDYIAYAVDQLKMTIVKLTMLSERRINYFLNQKVNRRFPPFINLDTPGLSLALQGLQFVATSTTSQSQTLAFPQYVHSISTNADNQDIVSMGTDAALLTAKVLENAYIVITIELITLAQAVDFMKNSKDLSPKNGALYKGLRKVFPVIIKDRVIIEELRNSISFVKDEAKYAIN